MWTAGFVLLTLIVNAPLLPWVLRISGLSKGENPIPLTFPSWSSPPNFQTQSCLCTQAGVQCICKIYGSRVEKLTTGAKNMCARAQCRTPRCG